MPDPLSVGAAVVGLASVSAHIVKKLVKFIKNTKDAPKLAQAILAEVKALQGIIDHSKELILGIERQPGASLVLVEHVVVILSGCVLTFSEVEQLLESLNTEGDLDLIDCAKWARKESQIASMIGRLQNHKLSLTTILTVLGWLVTCVLPPSLAYSLTDSDYL